MSLEVYCNRCLHELNVSGAVLFGPPDKGKSLKAHLCVACWEAFRKNHLGDKSLRSQLTAANQRIAELEKVVRHEARMRITAQRRLATRSGQLQGLVDAAASPTPPGGE